MHSTSHSDSAQPASKLDWALYYIRHGIYVVPLHHIQKNGTCSCEQPDCKRSAGKHPRLSDWTKLATTDEKMIQMWWRTWPRANVGCVCGKESDLSGLDLDEGGADTVKRLEATLGPLPPCPRVLTGRGGVHLLFRYAPGISNGVKPEPGLDWRNEGGQLVGAGSFTVGEYYFEVGYSLDDLPRPELPPAWIAHFAGKQNGGGSGFQFKSDTIFEGEGRNNEMFRFCRSLKARGTSAEAIWAAAG